ncbi:hypothetical protein [Oceanobacillus chungangensis]|uniref:Uncharacterized protein n=1 Tax=Oceanobacillus chungangensis TaxID=1229152 RepID=A0A3D8PP04_9BACI|nr:hypothetical protein [Oceanobacillus chungangensis]RDW17714.1 hypothetical protein CWR45_10270 [Oceanobacillus chungangensis]
MGRNKYEGSWIESNFIEIDWMLSKENLVELLKSVVNGTSQFTHQQICNWCDKHYTDETELDGEKLYDVLEDISTQWDLYLTNTYTLKELQHMDFSKVKLPIEWFERWVGELS